MKDLVNSLLLLPDWLLIVDDDSYVFPHGLARAITRFTTARSSFEKENKEGREVYVGEIGPGGDGYSISSAGGILLSRAALAKMFTTSTSLDHDFSSVVANFDIEKVGAAFVERSAKIC